MLNALVPGNTGRCGKGGGNMPRNTGVCDKSGKHPFVPGSTGGEKCTTPIGTM